MKSPPKFNLIMLIAIVIGSMIGGGIFNLPQNIAVNASGQAILWGWLITGIGILSLCFVYQNLALKKPDLNNGVYAYARASSGEFIGFNCAWGYWLSAVLGNVSYLIAAFAALGYFFPIFGEGNTTIAILGASIVLWLTHFFILRGIKGAGILNIIITFAKIVPLLVFILFTAIAFQWPIFRNNFWHFESIHPILLHEQIKNTMLVTVWVFIGIEGASVYSARAEKRSDIGKATLIGFLVTLFLLIAVSLFSLGILPQSELAQLTNLSMAGVLEKVLGRWGALVIMIGLLLSVGGAFLAWTLLAAETLQAPAKDGLMPVFLASEKHGTPVNALWLTSGAVQLFLILILFSKATYLTLISLATAMILIPYLFTSIYAVQLIRHDQKFPDSILSIIAFFYCCWLMYAAGHYLLLSALLYLPGVLLFIILHHQQGKTTFKRFEKVIATFIFLLSTAAIYGLLIGKIGKIS